jgi:hypothetical protein
VISSTPLPSFSLSHTHTLAGSFFLFGSDTVYISNAFSFIVGALVVFDDDGVW